MTTATQRPPHVTDAVARQFGVGLARAGGGALVFSLPLVMTMEMWQLGFYVEPWRLALLLLLLLPLLLVLARYMGFEQVFRWRDAALDALVAFAVGVVVAACGLALFAVIGGHTPVQEAVGKVALQAVPGSIGALLAQSQLGGAEGQREQREQIDRTGYGGELAVMATGAVFLAFSVAPTEEVVLIAYKMTPWHALALVLASLTVMHAFVYAVEFRGQEMVPPGVSSAEVFLRFTVVGYALVLLISIYIMWTFGRLDGLAPQEIVKVLTVLGFPCAVGAAAARLIL